jgi:hypothetical protein
MQGMSSPQKLGWLDCANALVIPGDFIIESHDGAARVVSEQAFRKRYAPSSP